MVYDVVCKSLKKAFSTSWNAIHCRRENFSGYALVGTKGVGKTTILRHICLMTGILLPNYQSIFISAPEVCVDIDKMIIAGADEVKMLPNHPTHDMGDILCHFTASRCAIALFVDEAEKLYTENSTNWSSLHEFVSTTEPTFAMISGSSGVLPAMVKGNELDFPLLRHYVKELLFPLNGTKIRVEYVPLLRLEDYPRFLSHAYKAKIDEAEAQKLHIACGGILGSLKSWISEYDLFERNSMLMIVEHWETKYPRDGTALKQIFERLVANKTHNGNGDDINITNMPRISENEVLDIIEKHDKTCNSRQSLQKFIDDNYLCSVPFRCLTFGIPAYYLLTLRHPTVFLSYRSDGSRANGTIDDLATFFNATGKFSSRIDLILCDDSASLLLTLRNTLLPKWITVKVLEKAPAIYREFFKRTSIIFVNQAYLARLDEYVASMKENECSRELCDLVELMKRTKTLRFRGFFVEGPEIDRVKASEKMGDCLKVRNPESAVEFVDFVWYKYDNPQDVQQMWTRLLNVEK